MPRALKKYGQHFCSVDVVINDQDFQAFADFDFIAIIAPPSDLLSTHDWKIYGQWVTDFAFNCNAKQGPSLAKYRAQWIAKKAIAGVQIQTNWSIEMRDDGRGPDAQGHSQEHSGPSLDR